MKSMNIPSLGKFHGGCRAINTPEVLWLKVDKRSADECWPWMGYKNHQGYGRTWINNNGYYAHRVIFNLANPGLIELTAPKNKSQKGFLLHSCDNPSCCNPKHLHIGNYQENMTDCKLKGRRTVIPRSQHYRALFEESEYVEMIRMYEVDGMTAKFISEKYNVSRSTIKSIIFRHKNNARI